MFSKRKNNEGGQRNSRVMPSLISADVHIVGTLSAEGEMQIDGKVEGNVRAHRAVVGSSGVINGEIVAEEIVIRGEVNGPIRGRLVQLSAGARVVGDIVHGMISVESGAAFEGNIRRSDTPLEEVKKLPSPAAAAKADRKLARSKTRKSKDAAEVAATLTETPRETTPSNESPDAASFAEATASDEQPATPAATSSTSPQAAGIQPI
jgi:cytoskeletal protein CcmA (bactofilin family)